MCGTGVKYPEKLKHPVKSIWAEGTKKHDARGVTFAGPSEMSDVRGKGVLSDKKPLLSKSACPAHLNSEDA